MKYLRCTIVLFVLLLPLSGAFAAGPKDREGISKLGYSIQVGAFAEVKNAERLTVKLQAKGVEAFYFKKDNGVYAVRFGDSRPIMRPVTTHGNSLRIR